nr:hypothetical protein StreXyl84_63270 [Streptomyces sp. Xyl84]
MAARDTDGPIKPRTGMVGYSGETERVYPLLPEDPALQYGHAAFLATKVRSIGIGRAPRFSRRAGKPASRVVVELGRRTELIAPAIECAARGRFDFGTEVPELRDRGAVRCRSVASCWRLRPGLPVRPRGEGLGGARELRRRVIAGSVPCMYAGG